MRVRKETNPLLLSNFFWGARDVIIVRLADREHTRIHTIGINIERSTHPGLSWDLIKVYRYLIKIQIREME